MPIKAKRTKGGTVSVASIIPLIIRKIWRGAWIMALKVVKKILDDDLGALWIIRKLEKGNL
jgi:hypothetical protein